MKEFKKYILIILLLASACQEPEAPITKTIAIPSFAAIEINSSFEIVLVESTDYAVTLTGAENRLSQVLTIVEDDILKVTDANKVKWVSPRSNKVILTIHSPQFSSVTLNETASIQTLHPLTTNVSVIMGSRAKLVELNLSFNGGSFYYWNNFQCGGKVTLRGNTNSISLFTFSSVAVDALALNTDYAFIENNSKGNCEVFVNNLLECSLRGTGDILFRGNPEIIVNEKTSSGQLISLD